MRPSERPSLLWDGDGFSVKYRGAWIGRIEKGRRNRWQALAGDTGRPLGTSADKRGAVDMLVKDHEETT